MKKILSVAIFLCGYAWAVDGAALFKQKGCNACHKPNVEAAGPSLKKIAGAYAGKKADLVKFLKGEGKPIVDPARFAIMQAQLARIKGLSDAEYEALADFILKHK